LTTETALCLLTHIYVIECSYSTGRPCGPVYTHTLAALYPCTCLKDKRHNKYLERGGECTLKEEYRPILLYFARWLFSDFLRHHVGRRCLYTRSMSSCVVDLLGEAVLLVCYVYTTAGLWESPPQCSLYIIPAVKFTRMVHMLTCVLVYYIYIEMTNCPLLTSTRLVCGM